MTVMNILLRPAIPYIVHIMGGAESSGTGTQETADPVKDLATRYNVSEREVAYLRRRFQALNPDEAGLIDRSVFQHPPYSTDPFCRQIWKRFSGTEDMPHKISFYKYAQSMIWWQKASVDYKLELLFSWMKDVNAITPDHLVRILAHVLPDYKQEELKQIAVSMVTMMSGEGQNEVDLLHFIQWFEQIPRDRLLGALKFNISTRS